MDLPIVSPTLKQISNKRDDQTLGKLVDLESAIPGKRIKMKIKLIRMYQGKGRVFFSVLIIFRPSILIWLRNETYESSIFFCV